MNNRSRAIVKMQDPSRYIEHQLHFGPDIQNLTRNKYSLVDCHYSHANPSLNVDHHVQAATFDILYKTVEGVI